MLAIYKRELKSYFTSMIGYIFIAFFLVIIGIYYVIYNLVYGYGNFEIVLSSVSFLYVVLVPILTMRIMAEEKRQKTDQLLLTSPIPPYQIILGKYLAVITVFTAAIGITCFYPLILLQFGNASLNTAYTSLLGFFLLGASFIAIGVFISSLTENQIVAAVISFIVILLTTIIDGIVGIFPSDNKSTWIILSVIFLFLCYLTYVVIHNIFFSLILGIIGEVLITGIYFLKPSFFDGLIVKIFDWFSIVGRFESFYMAIIKLSDLVYYISIIFLFLFLTVQSIKKSRWY